MASTLIQYQEPQDQYPTLYKRGASRGAFNGKDRPTFIITCVVLLEQLGKKFKSSSIVEVLLPPHHNHLDLDLVSLVHPLGRGGLLFRVNMGHPGAIIIAANLGHICRRKG